MPAARGQEWLHLHERLKTWISRPRNKPFLTIETVTCSAYFGQAPFSPKEKKEKKTIITQHAVTGVHNLLCVKAAAVTTL